MGWKEDLVPEDVTYGKNIIANQRRELARLNEKLKTLEARQRDINASTHSFFVRDLKELKASIPKMVRRSFYDGFFYGVVLGIGIGGLVSSLKLILG